MELSQSVAVKRDRTSNNPPERPSIGSPCPTSWTEIPAEGAHLTPSEIDPERSFAFWSIFPPPVVQRLPAGLVQFCNKAVSWLVGSQPPRRYHLKGFWEQYQTAPLRWLDRLVPHSTTKVWLFVAFCVLWLSAFISILHRSVPPKSIEGYGSLRTLSCVSRLWPNETICGVDGDRCRPFDQQQFIFRCPAGCRNAKILNPRYIGAQEVNYRNLVIGGSEETNDRGSGRYRGDSFICGAAIHAGVTDDRRGGAGIVRLSGRANEFPASERNDIRSIAFNSSFPFSFRLDRPDDALQKSLERLRDPRWTLFAVTVTFTSVLSILTASPSVFFASSFSAIFFQVALASDPPNLPDFDSVVSAAIGRFLPSAFVAGIIYQTSVRRVFLGLEAQFEKTILWLGPCWVGALSNETLEKIPLQRLTSHDLRQQPGAIAALVIIILLLVAIAIVQARCFRVEGRLSRYLAFYVLVGLGIVLLLPIPRLQLRLHHYILALLLLPGTSIQSRPSLVYQGLLVGLFINGTARWGFASLLQTRADILEDARIGSVIPGDPSPTAIDQNIIHFVWTTLATGFGGISIVINDVERYRGFMDPGTASLNFTWSRDSPAHEYFRFAYVGYSLGAGPYVADYSKPAVWQRSGNWTRAPP